jgi:hypothetical protein
MSNLFRNAVLGLWQDKRRTTHDKAKEDLLFILLCHCALEPLSLCAIFVFDLSSNGRLVAFKAPASLCRAPCIHYLLLSFVFYLKISYI